MTSLVIIREENSGFLTDSQNARPSKLFPSISTCLIGQPIIFFYMKTKYLKIAILFPLVFSSPNLDTPNLFKQCITWLLLNIVSVFLCVAS